MYKIKFNQSTLNIEINESVIKIFNIYKQRKENDVEKGGVLMGKLYPSSNKIVITHALICNNQESTRYELNLNTKCLQEKILKIWEESNGTITYLGDWHTHPEKSPKPSITDYKTFILNYFSSKFDQNLLLYIIVGNAEINWGKSFNGFLFNKLEKSI
ncbi:Mov34/MPN/PAD-1 family protein [Aliarcobacter butzleri]|uniref:Mov34/MPN/PAD-1 family protein n=1 Tax=Aliarcobacter butzleri TaxID=28197 RepID=UPI001EE000B3|nr:Mov34/MPN/PAD-1 family protein [Aliarcobacter butzleri]MCG3699375.1 Mov34/MPN/PAD-1 family protein [Aliarcobacter butzleri]MCT7586825.1 Mov34/MPN/PAD-1 family protein [Aliarcobacter butzleri]MDS1316022.1 Mov34/MPN/PAD-1 family protein [Aliarcobacter butzleri]